MPPGPGRDERLLNLLACLLDSPAGRTMEELVAFPELGYPPRHESARRAFERDKDSLRAMGVPIAVSTNDGEHRYRVDPREYYLPDLDLTDDERAALWLAVTAVALESGPAGGRGGADPGSAGTSALLKLGGFAGGPAEPVAVLPLDGTVVALFEAYQGRAPVSFRYRGETRTVDPWGLSSRRGHWYLAGRDHARDARRTFRTDRIEGEVEIGTPGTVTVPADFRAAEVLADQPLRYGDGPPVTARIRVDPGWEAALSGFPRDPEARFTRLDDGALLAEMPVVNRDAFRSLMIELLEHAVVLDPPELRDDLVAWLRAVAGEVA